MTLKEVKETIRDIFPTKQHFSETTLSRALGSELITLKMSRDCPQERNSPSVKDSRHAYATWMLSTGLQQQLVYIDEAGMYCNNYLSLLGSTCIFLAISMEI